MEALVAVQIIILLKKLFFLKLDFHNKGQLNVNCLFYVLTI